jgi:hypothetical protein
MTFRALLKFAVQQSFGFEDWAALSNMAELDDRKRSLMIVVNG